MRMSRERAAQGSLAPNDMEPKHASLMQDYLQLQDEFAALEGRLRAAKMTKVTLNAEVRFLRLRLKKLKGTPSDLREKEISCVTPCNSLTAYRSKAVPGAVMAEPSIHSTKNNSLGTTEIPVFRGLLRTNGSEELIKQKAVNEHTGLVSTPKTSAFRNTTTNVFAITMSGKRKISWQDEISLKCN